MSDVTGHDVGERPHGHGLAARRSHPSPSRVVQPAQNSEVRLPKLGELLDEIRQAAAIEAGAGDVIILLETRERVFIAATEAERAKPEYTLGVRHVAEDFPHAPLSWGVPELLPFRDEGTSLQSDVVCLSLQDTHDVCLGDQRHVARIEGREFSRARSVHTSMLHVL